MIPVMYGNNYQILQTPGFVVITYEIIHEARVIPLDGRPHVGAAIACTWAMRAAAGRATRSSSRRPTSQRRGLSRRRTRRTLRVVERFTRVPPDTIDWTATIDDPEDVDAAVDDRDAADARPAARMPFECHEGNYGLGNILKAARAAEK